MIEIINLTAGYGKTPVMRQLSARFNGAAVHGIVGLNGAGKSTFFNVLARVKKQAAGEILLNNQPIKRSDTGYLETGNFFYSSITGREYLNIFPSSNSGFQLESLQQLFRLPLDDLTEHYSTGMKKKLALLAILKQDKPVYILDEPFNGLDMETNKALEAIIDKLKQKGKLVLVSSHIMEPLLQTCDFIHYLAGGVFQKSFGKEDFSGIDKELFSVLRQQARDIVEGAV